MDDLGKPYMEEKGETIVEMWKSEWLKLYNKSDVSVNEHLRELFSYKHPLRQDQLLNKQKSGSLFRYVQCDIKVPELLTEQFAYFPPIFKNTN